MNGNILLAIVLAAIALAAGVFGGPARAQQSSPLGQGHHHPFHQDFYRGWMRPDVTPPASCCNARVTHSTGNTVHEVGDCEPTQAEVRNGQWYVWVRQLNGWLPVPDAKIIRVRNPNVVDGHLCWTPANGIMCFSPPDTGG